MICPPQERRNKSHNLWTFQVGDVVAVDCPDSNPPYMHASSKYTKNKWYPYRGPWSVCAIESIHKSTQRVRVRWLYRLTDLDQDSHKKFLKACLTTKSSQLLSQTMEQVIFTPHKDEVRCDSILGPVLIVSKDEAMDIGRQMIVTTTKSSCGDFCRLPWVTVWCEIRMKEHGGLLELDAKNTFKRNEDVSSTLDLLVDGGLNVSLPTITKKKRKTSMTTTASPARSTAGKKDKQISSSLSPKPCGRPRRETQGDDESSSSRPRGRPRKVTQGDGNKDETMNASFNVNEERNASGLSNGKEEDETLKIQYGSVLNIRKGRTYYSSISLVLQREKFAFGAVRRSSDPWKVCIGDVVCVDFPRSKEPPEWQTRKHRHRKGGAATWYPFVDPWSVGQVLAIYTKEKNSDDDVRLEVRWLYRRADLPEEWEKLGDWNKEKKGGDVYEELFETDDVSGLSALSLLGRVRLTSDTGEVMMKAMAGEDNKVTCVPTVNFMCYRYYSTKGQQVMRLPFSESNFCERGVVSSTMMENNDDLRSEFIRLLGLREDIITRKGVEDNRQHLCVVAGQNEAGARSGSERSHKSMQISLPWSSYVDAGVICPAKDQMVGFRWSVNVGDILAVDCPDSNIPYTSDAQKEGNSHIWYPYKGPWSICEVRNILSEKTVRIRWLYRLTDYSDNPKLQKQLKPPSKLKHIEQVIWTDHTDEIECGSILGPILVLSKEEALKIGRQMMITSGCLPWVNALCSTIGAQSKRCFKRDEDVSSELDLLIGGEMGASLPVTVAKKRKSLASATPGKKEGQISSTFSPKPRGRSRRDTQGDAIKEDSTNASFDANEDRNVSGLSNDNEEDETLKMQHGSVLENRSNQKENRNTRVDQEKLPAQDTLATSKVILERRIWTSSSPYHVDISSGRSYYTSLEVLPPYDSYIDRDKDENEKYKKQNKCWTVSLGDTVVAEWSHLGVSAEPRHPFAAQWAPCEVVSIWKNHICKDELMKLRKNLLHVSDEKKVGVDSTHNESDIIMMEVRWLYEKHDIPGAAKTQHSEEDKTKIKLEEVFETDHINECYASALLAPITIHSEINANPSTNRYLGMPVKHFFCERFWSYHRKSLVPIGSIKNRINRGRLYSRYLGKDGVLQAALNESLRAHNDEHTSSTISFHWKDAFHDAIKILSLCDASADAPARGLALPGRDKEYHQISTFLRTAICGVGSAASVCKSGEELSVNSALFVAGPPGTGKTATVRSVVANLRREQAKGEIPEFDFVPLNGMELRHPFDAYVKFWEAISGTRKEKRSPGTAAAMLERHFGGGDTKDDAYETVKKKPVTVLLLDEIDYLVTKKQTVLYNLFDWPMRAATCDSKGRLVVVGISNTINMPERLKPSIQSRLGGKRCIFQAYNKEDAKRILEVKLKPAPIFENDAIEFAARKTAVNSGDIRRAFQMCKAAAERVMAEAEYGKGFSQNSSSGPTVQISDIQKASRELFNPVIARAVSHATSLEALIIVSLASLQRQSGREMGGFDVDELISKMEGTARSLGDLQYLPPPSFAETLDILNRLGEAGVIQLDTPKIYSVGGSTWPLVTLPMDCYEVEAALRGTRHSRLSDKFCAPQTLF
uniref:BAH domain-containing protein n=1 Tax=Ditylum brightwellii TaxID=49249 RepID=A0A7S1YP31_9STRA